MTIKPSQCRAARGLLQWSQSDLAAKAKVARATLAEFEIEKREPYARTLADIQRALEDAGVEFTNGGRPGVRMVKVDWRSTKLGDEPTQGRRIIVQYLIGKHQTQPAVFNPEKREWHLDSGRVVPESDAGDWAPGPWPISASDVPSTRAMRDFR